MSGAWQQPKYFQLSSFMLLQFFTNAQLLAITASSVIDDVGGGARELISDLKKLLGSRYFSTLWIKEQVLHSVRARLKVPGWSLLCTKLPSKMLPIFFRVWVNVMEVAKKMTVRRIPRTPLRRNPLRWPIYIINSVVKTQWPCYTPRRRNTTVSLQTYPSFIQIK